MSQEALVAEAPFFLVRQGEPSDHAYVTDSWLMEYKRARNHGPRYFIEQKAIIRQILDRVTTELRVACDIADPDAIFGYAVVEGPRHPRPRVYYVYTKGQARHLGIASTLLRDLRLSPAIYTHKPRLAFQQIVRVATPRSWSYSNFANFVDKPIVDARKESISDDE